MNPVPHFTENSEDNTRCFQACAKMAMDTLSAEMKEKFQNLEDYDVMTGKPATLKYTWPFHFAQAMAESGYDVIYMDPMDLNEFVAAPEACMTRLYGADVARDQMKNSDISAVVQDARAMLTQPKLSVQRITPQMADLIRLVQRGYLAIVNVNARVLKGRDGYTGHFVLVYDVYDKGVVLHDPGLPANPESQVDAARFQAAWSYAGEPYQTILAIRNRAGS